MISEIQNYYPIVIIIVLCLCLIWIKNKHLGQRYTTFILLSFLITGLFSPLLHNHFYKWGVGHFAEKPNIYLARVIARLFEENIEQNKVIRILDESFNSGESNYIYYDLKVFKDNEEIFQFNRPIPIDQKTLSVTTSSIAGDYIVKIQYSEEARPYWKTPLRYLRALGRGEVFYWQFPAAKYTDVFMFNIIVLILLEIAFMHYAFRRNVSDINELVGLYKEDLKLK